jgi:predicted transcriptional regulator
MVKKTAKAEASDRGTTSVTVRLDNDLVAWLDARAQQENRSRANLIETLLKRAKEETTVESRA